MTLMKVTIWMVLIMMNRIQQQKIEKIMMILNMSQLHSVRLPEEQALGTVCMTPAAVMAYR